MSLAKRIAEELAENGFAAVAAAQIFPDETLRTLSAMAREYAASPEVLEANRVFQGGKVRGGNGAKPFLIAYRGQRARQLYTIEPDALGRAGVLPKLTAPLAYFSAQWDYHASNLLHHFANGNIYPRRQSQWWHRDSEQGQILKAFLFFDEVDVEAGPFEYVRGSHKAMFDLCPAGVYPELDIDARVPAEARMSACVPAMTVVYADTHGIHRGGYTRSKTRTNAVWTWLAR